MSNSLSAVDPAACRRWGPVRRCGIACRRGLMRRLRPPAPVAAVRRLPADSAAVAAAVLAVGLALGFAACGPSSQGGGGLGDVPDVTVVIQDPNADNDHDGLT